jgi:hypothetical protein
MARNAEGSASVTTVYNTVALATQQAELERIEQRARQDGDMHTRDGQQMDRVGADEGVRRFPIELLARSQEERGRQVRLPLADMPP